MKKEMDFSNKQSTKHIIDLLSYQVYDKTHFFLEESYKTFGKKNKKQTNEINYMKNL